MDQPEAFAALLSRWASGDEAALAELLGAELPWIAALARRRLGDLLRRRVDTQDIVQDAAVDLLRCGPRVVVRDRTAFRALLARIVENTLRDAHERHTAARRDLIRERALPSESSIVLDASLRPATRPSEAAAKLEERAVMRLAVELLPPDDREIVLLRGYQELEFAACAAHLGIGIKAAQMRFARALPRLAQKIEQLQRGELEGALAPEAG